MNIDALRNSIAALQSERKALQQWPLGPTDVKAAARTAVDALAAEGTKRVDLALARLAAGHSPRATIAEMLVTRGEVSPAILVALVGAGKMGDMLQERLDVVVPAGPNAAERAQRVIAIDAELDELEAREEGLLVALEEAGTPIARRADCRPEIVLAVVDPTPSAEPEEVLPMPDSVRDALQERAQDQLAENMQPVQSEYMRRKR